MLTPEQKQRYLQQLLAPHVGFEGQERLLGATFSIASDVDREAADVCRRYLLGAGLRESADGEKVTIATEGELSPSIAGARAATRIIAAIVRDE